ncbi:hypothetical protein BIV25_37950 [Streptomyces sp. MUSC 14]|uniref:hypothetical protein n=1 Tax=Streptomyces sp. MUSC 14 TaxID=1354889 RepID=UPI00091D1DCA|nr:hypothetical protein [Streptomyces sp. MUSC 14]OIJ87748.1 hypothetical protein BIV25_37950 [Streptomyces sp. MUSC 14]
MPTTDLRHSPTPSCSPRDSAQLRIDAAVRILTDHVGDTLTPLTRDLLTVLDPPREELGSDAVPGCPPAPVLLQRMADRLAVSWPRLAFGDFATDLARDALEVVSPVIAQLHETARTWRRHTVATLAERDRARDLAVTLEQANAEAVRLLRAGRPNEALTILNGDGQPVGPSDESSFADGVPSVRPALEEGGRP